MSLFRRKNEARSVTPESLLALHRSIRSGDVAPMYVDADTAMRHTAVWACLRLVAGTVSSLPIDVVKESGTVRKEVPAPGIIASPSALVSAATWREQLITSAMLRGNAYALVTVVDRAGYPQAAEVLHPDRVAGRVVDGRIALTLDGEPHEVWPRGDIIHMPAFTVPGSPFGLSVIDYAATVIGGGLAAERFGADFFTSGAVPSAVLSSDQVLTPQQADEAKARFVNSASGREPAVLGANLRYQQIQVRPDESQFLESMRFSGEQICRLFLVAPEMIGLASSGSSVTYANREQRMQDFLTITLGPWVARLQDTLTSLVPRGQVARVRTAALLRADIASRYSVYESAARIGRMTGGRMPLTVDEMRALEDLPPLPDEPEPQDEPASVPTPDDGGTS